MNTRWLLVGSVSLAAGISMACADDWTQWRGPGRTDISKETGLLQQWAKGGPKLVWKTTQAGLGFSGFAAVGDIVYTMGARNEEEFALALSAKDGKQLWATKLGPIFTFPDNVWGDGPRATPTVDGDRVYCLSGRGELTCLKRDSGDVVWRKSFLHDFGGQIMVHNPDLTGPGGWGYCESPLVDGAQLVCCPGGQRGWMIAIDKRTGAVRWRTRELTDEATDSSIIVATIGGVKQYINSTYKSADIGGGVAGVDAVNGKVLWYAPLKRYAIYAICPTPVEKDNLVYVTAGYAAGCNLLKVTKNPVGKFSVEDLYNGEVRPVMQNTHGGVVLWDRHIYGFSDATFTCQDFATGKEIWRDRNAIDASSSGSLTFADGHLYLLSDVGEVVLLLPSPMGWQEKGRFTLPALSQTRKTRPTHKSIGVWTHPVVANGQLYLRDQEIIYCYAVR